MFTSKGSLLLKRIYPADERRFVSTRSSGASSHCRIRFFSLDPPHPLLTYLECARCTRTSCRTYHPSPHLALTPFPLFLSPYFACPTQQHRRPRDLPLSYHRVCNNPNPQPCHLSLSRTCRNIVGSNLGPKKAGSVGATTPYPHQSFPSPLSHSFATSARIKKQVLWSE